MSPPNSSESPTQDLAEQGGESPETACGRTKSKHPLKRWSKRRRVIKYALLATFFALCFSVVPVWRLCWRYSIYNFHQFIKVKDSSGKRRAAWKWVEGRNIRVYAIPPASRKSAEDVASGIREIAGEAGLEINVEVQEPPENILKACSQSLVQRSITGRPAQCVSFKKLQSQLIALRDGDPHADVLIVEPALSETTWAYGLSSFRSGVAVLRSYMASKSLGKHEGCHLLGYMMHDSFPLFVFGYPWEGWPWSRDTLMMLNSTSSRTSPRAVDALKYLWKGLDSGN